MRVVTVLNVINNMPQEQQDRIISLEVNQKNLMQKLEENQITNEKAHEAILCSIEKMSDKLDVALSKKANKWVETSMIWIFSAIGITMIGLLIRWLVLLELK